MCSLARFEHRTASYSIGDPCTATHIPTKPPPPTPLNTMANDPSTTADPNEDDLPRLFEHPVVVFPIHNRRSTASAAIGTLLRDVHESDVLTSAKRNRIRARVRAGMRQYPPLALGRQHQHLDRDRDRAVSRPPRRAGAGRHCDLAEHLSRPLSSAPPALRGIRPVHAPGDG